MDHAHKARVYLGSAENASGDHLDTAQEATINALTGIGHALLDVAAAIREQTKATAPRPGADLPADIAKDYHTEAVEGIAEVITDVNVTLDGIRTEIADLRAVVDKAARR